MYIIILSVKGSDVKKTINKKTIIKDLTFKFPKNEIILIEGSNGCGKSMMLKMIVGLIKPTSGSIKVNGKISYAPDYLPSTINLTIREYLDFLDNIYNDNEHNIEDLIIYFKLNNLLDRRLNLCSKGTKQKVNLIQCLIKNADIYILDEPFSGLDKKAIISLKKLIVQKQENATIILTSHEELLDESFVTHKFNLENKKWIELQQRLNPYKEIKVKNKNHNKIKDMMKSFDKVKVFHHKEYTIINVDNRQSNNVLKVLINNGYLIEEVNNRND